MATEIKAPVFPESVADGTIATWHKQPGEAVSRDEVICDIETDKVVLEVVAPADGTIAAIVKNEGDTVLSAEVIAQFEEGAVSGAAPAAAPQAEQKAEPAAAVQAAAGAAVADQAPAVRKALTESGIPAADVAGTGRGGRITKEDVAKLKTQAVTLDMVETWQKFYENETLRNAGNPTAPFRAQLMKKIAGLW